MLFALFLILSLPGGCVYVCVSDCSFNEAQAHRDAMFKFSWIYDMYKVVAATFTRGASMHTADPRASPLQASWANLPPMLFLASEVRYLSLSLSFCMCM